MEELINNGTVETETPAVEVNQDNYQSTSNDELSWENDNRYKDWAGDPNKLYKNYRDIEKQYSPLKQRHSILEKEYNEYKSQANQWKAVYESINEISNHPEYSVKFKQFLENLDKKDENASFNHNQQLGINTLDQNKMDQAIKYIEYLQNKEQKELIAKQQQEKFETISKQEDKIKEFCKNENIVYDEAVIKDFFEVLKNEQVPLNAIYTYFKGYIGDHIKQKSFIDGQESAQKAIQKNSKGSLPSNNSSKMTPPPTKGIDFRTQALNALKSLGS